MQLANDICRCVNHKCPHITKCLRYQRRIDHQVAKERQLTFAQFRCIDGSCSHYIDEDILMYRQRQHHAHGQIVEDD